MKNTKRNKFNQVFSAFLVIGFIVCSYFFSTLASKAPGILGVLLQLLILLLFGLLLFWATRVGEGKAVKRFSLSVLLLVDIPALYIILATLIDWMPLHTQLASVSLVVYLATVGLGYAIPYTFLSGFEMIEETDEDEEAEDAPVLEGGLAEELLEAQKEDEETDEKPDGEETEAKTDDAPAEDADSAAEEEKEEVEESEESEEKAKEEE